MYKCGMVGVSSPDVTVSVVKNNMNSILLDSTKHSKLVSMYVYIEMYIYSSMYYTIVCRMDMWGVQVQF